MEQQDLKVYEFIGNKKKVRRVLFLSGAGLSKESGIPTFRDAAEEGIWENYEIDDVCNISTFRKNYNMVHAFYNERRMALEHVEPNMAHLIIAELQNEYGYDRVLHITANVDDLCERAGGSAMHVHGNLTEIIEPWSYDNYSVRDIGYTEFKPDPEVLSKPAVVFFGECYRYENGRRKDLYSEMYDVIDSLTADDVVFVIGSSDIVLNWSSMVGVPFSVRSININPMKHPNDYKFTENVYESVTDVIDYIREVSTEVLESELEIKENNSVLMPEIK